MNSLYISVSYNCNTIQLKSFSKNLTLYRTCLFENSKRILDSNIMFAAGSIPTSPTSVTSLSGNDSLGKKYYRKAAHRSVFFHTDIQTAQNVTFDIGD